MFRNVTKDYFYFRFAALSTGIFFLPSRVVALFGGRPQILAHCHRRKQSWVFAAERLRQGCKPRGTRVGRSCRRRAIASDGQVRQFAQGRLHPSPPSTLLHERGGFSNRI